MNNLLNIFRNKIEREKFILKYSNPFDAGNCNSVIFNIRKSYQDELKYEATVYFKNKDTEGKQQITSNDFISLVLKTEQFIKSLI